MMYVAAGHDHVLCLLGHGDVLGEVRFLSESPRLATVVAVTDTEILVLTQSFFRKIMGRIPDVTAKVPFNMSLRLCHRLRQSADQWLAAVAQGDAPEDAAARHVLA